MRTLMHTSHIVATNRCKKIWVWAWYDAYLCNTARVGVCAPFEHCFHIAISALSARISTARFFLRSSKCLQTLNAVVCVPVRGQPTRSAREPGSCQKWAPSNLLFLPFLLELISYHTILIQTSPSEVINWNTICWGQVSCKNWILSVTLKNWDCFGEYQCGSGNNCVTLGLSTAKSRFALVLARLTVKGSVRVATNFNWPNLVLVRRECISIWW